MSVFSYQGNIAQTTQQVAFDAITDDVKIYNKLNINKIEKYNQEKCINLSQIKKGNYCKVLYIDKTLNYNYKLRLLELGIVQDVVIKVAHVSLLGKVMLIELNGYTFSIRKDMAKYIMVKIL